MEDEKLALDSCFTEKIFLYEAKKNPPQLCTMKKTSYGTIVIVITFLRIYFSKIIFLNFYKKPKSFEQALLQIINIPEFSTKGKRPEQNF